MHRAFLAVSLGVCLGAVPGSGSNVVVRQALTNPPTDAEAGTISGDGRFVAFVSMAKLLPADGNLIQDVYVLDRQNDRITLESSAFDGKPADGSSIRPKLSIDGRYLSFDSSATNLTGAPDDNEMQDAFLRDRQTGVTRRISNGLDGRSANGSSEATVISADGRVVVFQSSATNLVHGPDANGARPDIYMQRLDGSGSVRVSVDDDGRQYSSSHAPSVSADGQLVAFVSTPAGAQPGPGTSKAVHVRDMLAGRTTCISCARVDGRQPSSAFAPHLSADGRIVAFAAVTGTNGRSDIAVHDRSTGLTTLVTRGANARSLSPRLSGTGRHVVFESWASDLICSLRCSNETLDDNLLPDVYRFDRETKQFTRLSGSRQVWWAPSVAPSMDARGETVVFSSRQQYGPEDVTVDFDQYVCSPSCE
ncbi:MAG: TolB family protein [Vicinamibacterales bacterium]